MTKRLIALALALAFAIPAAAADKTGLQKAEDRLNSSLCTYELPESSGWEFCAPSLEGRLTVSGDGKTATLFAPGVTETEGWKDTNKHWDGKDSNLCWAAADSNLISWYLDTAEAGEAVLGDARRDNMDIFDHQFRGIWDPYEGFDMNNGLSWYFTGRFTNAPGNPDFNPPSLSDPDKQMMLTRDPGGYLRHLPHVGSAFLPLYPEILYPDEAEDMRQFVGDTGEMYPFAEVLEGLLGTEGNLSTHQSFSNHMLRALRYGAAGLTVKEEGSLGGGHAVTLWGADFDPDTGKISHIYITDSDDHADQLRKVTVTARNPDQNGIYLTDFSHEGGGKWTRIADTQNLFAYGAVREKGSIPPEEAECDWEETTYQWNEAHTKCTAARVCRNHQEHRQTAEGTVTAEVTAPAACTEWGKTTYTAEFQADWAETQRVTLEDIPPLGHRPGKPVRENEVPPTYREDGSFEEVIYCTVCGKEISREKIIIPRRNFPFSDVPENEWYRIHVEYAALHGLMNGHTPAEFGPEETLTRAQMAQILFNKEGCPETAPSGKFTDVRAGDWYSRAVAWAAEKEYMGGYGGGLFGPEDPVTREQLAAILWRYERKPETNGNVSEFRDADEISDYAVTALRWALENHIMGGKGGGILDPSGSATRAEAAKMIGICVENVEKKAQN